MKSSMTFTFLSLFAVVGAVYFYFNPNDLSWQTANSSAPESMQLLPGLKQSAIVAIEIQNQERGESITLRKTEEGWLITKPVHYPADPLLTQGLIAALKLSQKARRLTPENKWSEYGLENPGLKVGIEIQGEDKPRTLCFGDAAPIGNFIFARWESENDYFLLQTDLKKSFDRSTYSLRRKQIFKTPLNEISKIRISTGIEVYEIAKRSGNWIWMEPIEMIGNPVAKEQVNEIMGKLADLNVKTFLDDEKRKPDELGFAPLGSALKIWGPGEQAEEIELGKESPQDDAYYARRVNEELYFWIARQNIKSLFEAVQIMAEGPKFDDTKWDV